MCCCRSGRRGFQSRRKGMTRRRPWGPREGHRCIAHVMSRGRGLLLLLLVLSLVVVVWDLRPRWGPLCGQGRELFHRLVHFRMVRLTKADKFVHHATKQRGGGRWRLLLASFRGLRRFVMCRTTIALLRLLPNVVVLLSFKCLSFFGQRSRVRLNAAIHHCVEHLLYQVASMARRVPVDRVVIVVVVGGARRPRRWGTVSRQWK